MISSNNSTFTQQSHLVKVIMRPNALGYLATKGSIEQISRVLAMDLGTHGIMTNNISG